MKKFTRNYSLILLDVESRLLKQLDIPIDSLPDPNDDSSVEDRMPRELFKRANAGQDGQDLLNLQALSEEIFKSPGGYNFPSSRREDPSESVRRATVVHSHSAYVGIMATDASGRVHLLNAGQCAKLLSYFTISRALVDAAQKASVLFSRGNLAFEVEGDNKKPDAALYYHEALHLIRELFPLLDDDDKFERTILSRLAKLSEDMQDSYGAETYYLEAIRIAQRRFGREYEEIYSAINRLAILFERRGRYDDAMLLYRRSLAGRLQLHGRSHYDTAMSAQELACMALIAKDDAAGHILLEMALAGFRATVGADERFAMYTASNLCQVYERMQHWKKLRELLLDFLPRAPKLFTMDHMLTAGPMRMWIENFGTSKDMPPIVQQLLMFYTENYWRTGSELSRWALVPFVSAVSDSARMTQRIQEAGMDVKVEQDQPDSALYDMSAKGHEKVMQMLLDAGINIDTQGGDYGTALQIASTWGHEKIVRILLDAGVNINAKAENTAPLYTSQQLGVTRKSCKCFCRQAPMLKSKPDRQRCRLRRRRSSKNGGSNWNIY